MFRRKKDEPATPGTPGTGEGHGDLTAPPLKPFSRKGTHAPLKPPTSAAFHPEMPRRAGPEIPGLSPRRVDRALSADADSKRLLVGRDISLSGEITSCDHLVVEGRSEVVLSNARLIEVMPSGFFQGSADVEEADISGRFEGELIARDLLIVRSGSVDIRLRKVRRDCSYRMHSTGSIILFHESERLAEQIFIVSKEQFNSV